MASAPTVQSLQDIIGQITAAQQPQYQQIDSNINSNEQTGQGQVAGLNSAKDQAFGKIEQNASNKGMYFSGFSPNAQAGYTGSTYLPALAKLQNTIAATRQTLLGQKANLQTTANTQGINIHDSQQKALDAYNMEMQREAQAAAEAERNRQFQASEGAKNRSASYSRASIGRGPTAAQSKQGDVASMSRALSGAAGRDGFVSPQDWATARTAWTNEGYSASDFNNNFRNFANLTYGGASAGGDYGLKR